MEQKRQNAMTLRATTWILNPVNTAKIARVMNRNTKLIFIALSRPEFTPGVKIESITSLTMVLRNPSNNPN